MLHMPENSAGSVSGRRASVARQGQVLLDQHKTTRTITAKTDGLKNGLRRHMALADVVSSTQRPKVELAVYDNRLNVSFSSSGTWGPRHLLFRSAEGLGVPYTIGALDKDGGVGTTGPRKPWAMGDRESWLEQGVMPRSTASLVFHLDATDTLLLSSADEIAHKYANLTRKHGEELVISADAMLWPEDMQWGGRYVCAKQRETFASCAIGMGCCRTSEYPSAELPSRAALLRWANIGAVLGPPRSWLRLFHCMRELYPGYPRACPISRCAAYV
uniref:Uncharacterized protein n=1 Tax=Chrysotila carterae TaxID=13221 RepID=A0A6S9ZT03_CHRCT